MGPINTPLIPTAIRAGALIAVLMPLMTSINAHIDRPIDADDQYAITAPSMAQFSDVPTALLGFACSLISAKPVTVAARTAVDSPAALCDSTSTTCSSPPVCPASPAADASCPSAAIAELVGRGSTRKDSEAVGPAAPQLPAAAAGADTEDTSANQVAEALARSPPWAVDAFRGLTFFKFAVEDPPALPKG